MDPINDARFYESLIKPPHQRTGEDIRNIYEQLRNMEIFANLYNGPLKAIAASARYERRPAHFVLFRSNDLASSWYILLSGSVFIDNHIYLPFACFGKRNGLNYRRSHDACCLQESEMIVIDYPDASQVSPPPSVVITSSHHSGVPSPAPSVQTPTTRLIRKSVHTMQPAEMPPPPVPPRSARGSAPPPPRGLPRSYPVEFPVDVPSTSTFSVGENHKSQVYLNGSMGDEDTLVRVKHRREKSNSVGGPATIAQPAVINGPIRRLRVRSTASSTTTEGEEIASNEAGDSDEDDDGSVPSHESYVDLKDDVRECLEKEPSERNHEDIAVLMEFLQHLSAFAKFPMSIRRELCLKMVFAVVNDAGTVVMQNNEKLDSWTVIVNGCVEVVKPNGERVEYKLGDAFGAEPVPTLQLHEGEMRTLVDDCEFVLVEHRDFCSIMAQVDEHIVREEDDSKNTILEKEKRTVGNQSGLILIKGKPDRLIQHLVDERDHSVDPNYVDDFLLTYRVFIHDPTIIFEKLMLWFADSVYRDKVARIVLLWVNNHYNDFETNKEMLRLLERFEGALERDGMMSQQQLLNIACSVKAKPRLVTHTRANKDEPLQFSLIGGKDFSTGIFINDVKPDSQAEKVGIKRCDELLEVNQMTMKFITTQRAQELLMGSLSLTLLLKSNVLGFKELMARLEEKDGGVKNGTPRAAHQSKGSLPLVVPLKTPRTLKAPVKSSMMDKLMTILKANKDDDATDEGRQTTTELRPSRSNPDIASISQYYGPVRSECPEHVLKIFRGDQTFKYLPVYRETSAQNVVQLALQEFGMVAEGSFEWSLCEVTVTSDGVIKQRRLPPILENLAERIALNSRYYLKNNSRSDPLVPDDLAPELLKEAQTQLLTLNAQVVAAQLTLQSFAVFSAIEPTEYIDSLFQLESKYGIPKLEEFERLFNREMWWVATEICAERSVQRRAKLIKKFIKIARHCRELRNFNSMFAIISGLEKPAIRRLHSSWERVSGKYLRMLEDVQQLIDPSRNMSKYRQHLAEVAQEPPVVPIYPVIKKDLTFAHEGNPTYTDRLVNFEKLRLIGKAVRAVTKLASTPYEIGSMAERSGGVITDALLHMNTFESGNVATMRKGSKAANQPRKKIYEQAHMVRKVKAYLEGLEVIDNEQELDRLSYDIEPHAQTAGRSALRRAPSPTPSSLSGHSSGSNEQQRRLAGLGPRFGIESPQAVAKMLNLVQTSKLKGSPSPSASPLSVSRGLHRNVPRVTGRQSSAPQIQRIPSIKNEPVPLSSETSSVTSYYSNDSQHNTYHSSRSRSGSEVSVPAPFSTSISIVPPHEQHRTSSHHHLSVHPHLPPRVPSPSPSTVSLPPPLPSSGSSSLRGLVLGHRPVPSFSPHQKKPLQNGPRNMSTIKESAQLVASEQISRV